MIFDFDEHLYEYPTMWLDHIDPDKKDMALEVIRDDLGYPWVTSRLTNQRIYIYSKTVPEDGFVSQFEPWQRWKDGLEPVCDYVADMPAELTDPQKRVAKLADLGVDATVLYPHFGAVWGRFFSDRLEIIRANLSAWNRWAAAVRQEGNGRLEPVGHVTLAGGGFDWLDKELAYLSANGVRAATLSYGLVDGRRMAHPDHDHAWKSFVDNGITPIFHIQDADIRASGLDDGWFPDDADPLFGALDMAFSHLGVQVAIADLIFSGVFDRFPQLKFATVELSAAWFQAMLGASEGFPGSAAAGAINGPGLDISYRVEGFLRRNLVQLKKNPSEYLYENFRFTVNPMEPLKSYIDGGLEDNLMLGSDFPHCEGFHKPLETFRAPLEGCTDQQKEKFLGGNALALLGMS